MIHIMSPLLTGQDPMDMSELALSITQDVIWKDTFVVHSESPLLTG